MNERFRDYQAIKGERDKTAAALYMAVQRRHVIEKAEGFFLTKAGMHYFRDALFGETGLGADPRVSVLDVKNLTGLPTAFVSTAGYDPLSDEGIAYVKALQAAGIEVDHRHYDSFIHGFYNLAALAPAVLGAYDDVVGALKKTLG